jgi:AcrR family transcriptional regulator
VREIVHEAQVTNPMLYYYFKSKEGLFIALVETLVGSFDAQLEQLLDEDLPLKEKLLRVMQQHIRTAREVPTVLRFMFSVIFGPRDSVPALDMLGQRMCLMKKIAQIFEDAIASGELIPSSTMSSFSLAHNFMGLISNQMMFSLKMSEHLQDDPSYKLMFEHYMSDENTEALVNFFFAGAGKLKETAE